MSRKLLLVLAAAAAVASAAAAAVGVHWTVLSAGKTTSAGAAPVGYIAITKAQERPIIARLGDLPVPASVQRLNLQYTGLVAVFLDGMPCARDLTVTGVSRTATTLTVAVRYTRPPIGMAMCVRYSTPYVFIGASRKTLGHPVPTHVRVVAVARA